jgi:hypothetical protein
VLGGGPSLALSKLSKILLIGKEEAKEFPSNP